MNQVFNLRRTENFAALSGSYSC